MLIVSNEYWRHRRDTRGPPNLSSAGQLPTTQTLAFHCIAQMLKRTKQEKDQRGLSFGEAPETQTSLIFYLLCPFEHLRYAMES